MPYPTIKLRLGQPVNRLTLLRNAANPLRFDPTRTTLIRNQFQADMRRRFRELRANVWKFFTAVDALGLKERHALVFMALPQTREFQFQTDANKLTAFSNWLRQQIDADIFKTAEFGWQAPFGSMATGPWTGKYIESAYKRGLLNAFIQAKKDAGMLDRSQEEFLRRSFSQPEMMSKVQLLATRSFEQLKGITAQMAADMNRILAQGMIEGKSATAIARELVQKIDGMSESRAMMIARTEIINAHAEGQLDAFEELGIDELGLKAEFTTAGDERVCPICSALEGKVYTVAEARGVIPVHPNCRCSWTTV